MNALAGFFEEGGDGVLGQPVDLEIGLQLAKLTGDGEIAARMAEADRRGEIERALAPCHGAAARDRFRVDAPRRAVDEIADQPVHQHGIPRQRNMAGSRQGDERCADDVRDQLALGVWNDVVLVAVND